MCTSPKTMNKTGFINSKVNLIILSWKICFESIRFPLGKCLQILYSSWIKVFVCQIIFFKKKKNRIALKI